MTLKKIEHHNVSFVTVNDDHVGRRLDNFLIGHLSNIPKSRIYKMIRSGETRINKRRIKQGYRLQAGDIIRIPPMYTTLEQPLYVPSRLFTLISDSIIHEDDSLIIINKPSNIAVHGGSNVSNNVISILRQQRSDKCFLELVHRLDKATSGCLIIAKNHTVLRYMHNHFYNNNIKKDYLTLVKGSFNDALRIVNLPIHTEKNTSQITNKSRVSKAGKEALTYFHLLQNFTIASLIRIELMTGRTHQIRVHANAIGHPLAGDKKYGDFEFNRMMRNFSLKRLFLHAETISFVMPDTGKQCKFTAPLPDELQVCLNKLEKK